GVARGEPAEDLNELRGLLAGPVDHLREAAAARAVVVDTSETQRLDRRGRAGSLDLSGDGVDIGLPTLERLEQSTKLFLLHFPPPATRSTRSAGFNTFNDPERKPAKSSATKA